MVPIPTGDVQPASESFGGAVARSDGRDAQANQERSIEPPCHDHFSPFSAPRRSTYHSASPSDASQASSVSSDSTLEPLACGPRKASTFSVPRKPLPALSSVAAAEAGGIAPSTPFLGEKPCDATVPSGVTDIPLRWRPFYLRRSVLFAFAFLFALLIAVAQGLLAHSRATSGLGNLEANSRYVWQYGGTAVMTLVMALWARVEYQIKVAAPWIRLSRGRADPERTLLLDYVSEFQPVAIVKAFRYGDYLVGFISLVSLLLRVLIIAATAVISPSFIGVVSPETSVTLRKTFLNNAEPLRNVGSLPYFSMAGLVVNNLTYPDGTSKTHAYLPFAATHESVSAEVGVTVDGLTNMLDCEEADITLDGLRYGKSQWTYTNVTMSSGDCEYPLEISNQGMTGSVSNDTYRFFFMPTSCNGSDEPDDQRIAVGFVQIDFDIDSFPSEPWASNEPVNGTLGRTTQLICSPDYAITDVRVVKNGTELVSIRETGGDTRMLSDIHPADIMSAHFASYSSGPSSSASDGGPYQGASYFMDTDDTVEADTPMSAAMRFRMMDTNRPPTIDELLDAEYLTKLVQDYYKQFTVFIARGSLMEGASEAATGRSTINRDRLVARSLPIHLITGLLVPCLLIAAAAIFFVPRKGILPQAPTKLINIAMLLANSKPLLQALRGTGPADMATLRQRLAGSQYSTGIGRAAMGHNDGAAAPGHFIVYGGNPEAHQGSAAPVPKKWARPSTLSFASRAAGILVLMGMIVALEVLLRKSRSENGLADVRDDDNSIFWTTALPATLLGLVAFYYSIADNTIRTLSPFVKLKRGKPFRQTVALDLLDKSRPRIVWSAAMASDFATLASTMAVLVGAMLTIFSSALYTPVPVPGTTDTSIPATDYFASSKLVASVSDNDCFSCNPETVSASLILGANLTYPPFTFEDLAFQTLDTNMTARIFPTETKEEADLPELIVSLTLPALRSRLSCREYSRDDIKTNLTLGGYDISHAVHPLRIDTPAESCTFADDEQSNAMVPTADSSDSGSIERTGLSGDVYFGLAEGEKPLNQCSDWFYAWGSVSDANSNNTKVTNIGAMGCNETMEVVDAKVRLYGPELRIDPAHPPEVDESSARDAKSEDLNFLLYPWLANATSPHIVDQFFSLLVSSRYAIPPSDLAQASASGAIAEAIRHQHGIIRAQDMHFNRRAKLIDGEFPSWNKTSGRADPVLEHVTSAFDPSMSPEEAVPSIKALASSENSLSHRRRLVQDGTTTRVLQALLSSVLLFAILSWIFTRDDRVPRCDALLSIASMGSLLAEGNALSQLRPGAEWIRHEWMEEVFKEGRVPMGFGMGWEGERRKSGLFSLRSLGSWKKGGTLEAGIGEVREVTEEAGEIREVSGEYNSAYGSDRSYGIWVFKDGLDGGEGSSGLWGWVRGRQGYVPGPRSES